MLLKIQILKYISILWFEFLTRLEFELSETNTRLYRQTLINSLYTKKNIDLYITGSNAYLLSSELATLLTGRYIAINIQPYSFKEYTLANEDEKNTDRLFRKYINESSFPEAVTLSKKNKDLVNDYLQSIYDTVIIKDIAQRYKLRNIHNLHRVISFLFNSIGSYVSPTNIAKELNENSKKQISHNTIIKYLDFLTQSYILYVAPRYDIKGKELLTTNEKYYVVDLGLRNITATNKYDTDLGHKLENVVYSDDTLPPIPMIPCQSIFDFNCKYIHFFNFIFLIDSPSNSILCEE